jgi:hypothetical protein
MTYKNYLAVTGIRTNPETPSSLEKFETLDTEATSNVFKDTEIDFPEVDQALGTVVYKSLATVDFSDAAKLKAFQEKFLATESGKFAAYPTQRFGEFFSADIINVVRRMQDPTGNQFTIPVPSNLKDKFAEIFQGSITGKVASYRGIGGLFHFELNFNDGNPSYEQVLQLRSFMTLMEKEYSTMTGTELTAGPINADDMAQEFGPDLATLYDFALEYTEKTFDSKVMLSAELPEVDGTIVSAYLHAKQGLASDQPLKADDFFTRAMDGREIQVDFLCVSDDHVLGDKTYLDYIQASETKLTYAAFEKALGENTEPVQWDNEEGFFSTSSALSATEREDIQTVLTDFNNAIYVTFSWPIMDAAGTVLGKDVATGIYEPISNFKMITVAAQINDGVTPAQLAALPDSTKPGTHQDNAKRCFDEYLKARGF